MMEINKFRFKHPVRCVLTGPSFCGKTTFVRKVIEFRNQLFTVPPQRIIYTYLYPQNWFSLYPYVTFTRDLPETLNSAVPSLLVIDDLICEPKILKKCASFFTRGSHHLNCSVFFLTQNLFLQNSDYRTVSLNASHFVLFKNLRGLQQVETLARQIFGKNAHHFMTAFKDAVSEKFGYLLLDLLPEQSVRLRTKIFPDETEEIYVLDEEP